MKNIIVFGLPGAGKGTQAKIIAKENNLLHLSSGEISRNMIKDKVLGPKIHKCLTKGHLVPNYIIIELVEKYLKKNLKSKGIVFDGYPRNIGQAWALDRFVKKHNIKIDLVINLELSEDEALKRILLRGKTSGRSDDNVKTTKNRLKVYQKRTSPILEYYKKQKKLVSVNGKQSITKISKEIEKIIKKTLA